MQVTELVTKFSFKGSLKPLGDLNKGLSKSIGSITKVGAAMGVAGLAMGGYLAKTLSSANAQVQLARDTGIGIEALRELGYVAGQSGSSVSVMESSLSSLANTIGDAAISGSEDFSRLGISVRDTQGNVKDTETVFYEIAEAMRIMGLSAHEQRSMMGNLGLDASLLRTMKLTSTEMGTLRNEARQLGVVTEGDAGQVEEFTKALNTLKYGITTIKTRLAIAFAPALQLIADRFIALLDGSQDLMDEGIDKFIKLLGSGLSTLKSFADGVSGIADEMRWLVEPMKQLHELVHNTLGGIGTLFAYIGALFFGPSLVKYLFAGGVGIIKHYMKRYRAENLKEEADLDDVETKKYNIEQDKLDRLGKRRSAKEDEWERAVDNKAVNVARKKEILEIPAKNRTLKQKDDLKKLVEENKDFNVIQRKAKARHVSAIGKHNYELNKIINDRIERKNNRALTKTKKVPWKSKGLNFVKSGRALGGGIAGVVGSILFFILSELLAYLTKGNTFLPELWGKTKKGVTRVSTGVTKVATGVSSAFKGVDGYWSGETNNEGLTRIPTLPTPGGNIVNDNSSYNSTTNSNNNTIDISVTGDSPMEISKRVVQQLNEIMNNANVQFNKAGN